MGISVDHVPCLTAWAESLGDINYPLLSDFWPHGAVAEKYGVLHSKGYTERALFLIDKEGVVQHQVVNNLPLGRNVDEMIRVLDALQFTEQYGEVCPAGWNKGETGMKPTAEGVADYLSQHADKL